MSIFTFLKTAGEEISDFITGDGRDEDAIKERIKQLGLKVENLEVDVDGDTAKLKGTAATQDAREKAILAAGNIKGIAKVEANIDVKQDAKTSSQSTTSNAFAGSPTAQQESQFYQVKSGDTLSKIAKDFYGNPSEYNRIFEANKPMLSDPDKIYPGQTLRIPHAGKSTRAA